MEPSEALASNRAAIRHVVESHRARNARVGALLGFGQKLLAVATPAVQQVKRNFASLAVSPRRNMTKLDPDFLRLLRLHGFALTFYDGKALNAGVRPTSEHARGES